MKLLADASLPGLHEAFPPPFKLTVYDHQDEISALLPKQDILFCRSTLKVTRDLINSHTLSYIATASSGIDHIDVPFLNARGIPLIDAKGSNANAVADYVLATIAYLQTQQMLSLNKAAIIGLGAVGTKVIERLKALKINVIAYDPPKSRREPSFQSASLDEIIECDLICIHASLQDQRPYPSRHLINESILSQLKPGVVMINASRGDIVDENALLNTGSHLIYCTDVFANEPAINPEVVKAAYLCTPHIAGHSIEAKYQAVIHVSQKLHCLLKQPHPTTYAALPSPQTLHFNPSTHWQDYILKLYNPMHETIALKKAADKKRGFIQLRQSHQTRHDFYTYQSDLPPSLHSLLGRRM